MPISDQKLHHFARRTLAVGLLVISTGAVLQLTNAHQAIGFDPAAYGNTTIFGLLARIGGAIALFGLVGLGLRAAQRPASASPSLQTDEASPLPSHAQRGDSAPAPRLPSRIRPVRIPPHQVEHSA